jgi:hypothetical protein
VARVDPAIYDSYVGQYEADLDGKGKGTAKEVVTVSRNKDRLYCQLKGKSQVLLIPESETSFYIKADDSEARFLKDPMGRVTHLELIQNGRELKAARSPGKAKKS